MEAETEAEAEAVAMVDSMEGCECREAVFEDTDDEMECERVLLKLILLLWFRLLVLLA